MHEDCLVITGETPPRSPRSNSFAMDPSNRPSMQSLLHSPPGEDHDILQQSSGADGPYISDHSQMSYNQWATFNPHPSSLFERKIETLGNLQLPPDTLMDNSTSITRFMTDEASSRPLVELNNLGSSSGFPSHNHNSHLSIATSWEYQPSYPESVDASVSAVSSNYDYNPYSAAETSASAWTGSPDSHRFRDVSYTMGDTSPTSPGYAHGPARRGDHSHRPSMDGCLSPSSPGLSNHRTWSGASVYSADSNSGNTSPSVAPDAIGDEISLNGQGSYVNLKSIQLTPADEEKDDEKDDDAVEGHSTRRLERDSIPDIRFHGPERNDTDSWSNEQGRYYGTAPMEIECSSPSSCPSPQPPPRSQATLETRGERRSRSGSGASQLSAKSRAEMMKPFKDTTNPVGKSHRGRGTGKKQKERQSCPDHPNKCFKHNSDYRKHMQTQHTRPFLCTFHFAGCEQTFGSKNEWKRHVFSQHLRLTYWRCDNIDCADRNAIFNRKDLFGQHLKRMHGPKQTNTSRNSQQMKDFLSQEIPRIQERCLHVRRSPPEWSKCGYCEEEFRGEGSWDSRMEHVGKHYEKNNYKAINPKSWVMDAGLIRWAIDVKIVEKTEGGKYRLLASGKDSINGGEKRKDPMDRMVGVLSGDEEEDAEGEDEF